MGGWIVFRAKKMIRNYEEYLSGIPLNRYRTLKQTLGRYKHLFCGKTVLDYGASSGLSAVALMELGAASVTGIEPELDRVEKGMRDLAMMGNHCIEIIHLQDTTNLPYRDGEFEFVLSNAVFEHIPQPRDAHLCEVWRVLHSGGYFLLTETPNKYFPKEVHTSHLWFNHWLPKEIAFHRARRNGMSNMTMERWEGSGWRGLGYYEMVRPLRGYKLIPENTRLRHRILSTLRIPASIIDPYPDWLLQKN
jgi:ubiquinone/menaquinone biosynthesis C-methylase UbiE